MKKLGMFALMLAALGILAPSAMAEAGKGGKDGGKRREEMLKKFDKNGDGKLDDTEKAAAKAAFEKRMAEGGKGEAGKGGPGKKGGKGGKGSEERRAKMLAKFDKNGDGKLDDAERAEMKAAHEKRKADKK